MERIQNLVTVDLDESRVGGSADTQAIAEGLLDALDRAGKRATFFVSQAVANEQPAIARQITERGHEVASLTSGQVTKARPYSPNFCEELAATRAALENATGSLIRGHRNPTFSVTCETEWVYDALVDCGYEYDSSQLAATRPDSWHQPVPRTPHALRRWGGTLMELPITTAEILALQVPLGAPSTIRAWPMPLWTAVLNDRHARGEPVVLHLRAGELRGRPLERLQRIVNRFDFTSVASALPELHRRAPVIES